MSVRDGGFQYAAAFETMRAYDGRVFRLDAHLDPLAHSCSLLGIDHGISAETFRERVRGMLDANGLAEAYVRLSVSRGVQPGKLASGLATDPTVVVQVRELGRGPTWNAPATLETSPVQRLPDDAVPAATKTHNYLNGTLARRSVDADEALLLDSSGFVAEGATKRLLRPKWRPPHAELRRSDTPQCHPRGRSGYRSRTRHSGRNRPLCRQRPPRRVPG